MLVLAGAFAAGFALGRPDGLAYQFVPVVAAISLLTRSTVDRRAVLAFFGPLLFIELSVYAATYAELGLWESGKLDGKITLVILGVLLLSSAGPWIVQALDRVGRVRLAGERFEALVVSAAALLTAVALALKWDTAGGALDNARTNLFAGAGGYHYLWYGVVVLLVLSVLTGDALRPVVVDPIPVPVDAAVPGYRRTRARALARGAHRSWRQSQPRRVPRHSRRGLVRRRRGGEDPRTGAKHPSRVGNLPATLPPRARPR